MLALGNDVQGQGSVPPGAGSGVRAIAAGSLHNLALRTNGVVVAWGYGETGQTNVPPAIQGNAVAIAAGLLHSVALLADGSVVAWGDDGNRQTTVPAAARSRVAAIAAGTYHTLALFGSPGALRIRPVAEGVEVSWPIDLAGVTLQSGVDPGGTASWTNDPSIPATVDSRFVVTNATPGNVRWYRLK